MADFKKGERYQFKQDSQDGVRYGRKGQWCVLEEDFSERRTWGAATLQNPVEDQHAGVLGIYKVDLVPEQLFIRYVFIIQQNGGRPLMFQMETMEEGEREAANLVRLGYKILARKKITLPFSYMNAPELQPNAPPQAVIEPILDEDEDDFEPDPEFEREPNEPNW